MEVIWRPSPPSVDLGTEHETTLLATPAFRLVQIVSRGYASSPGHVYDQDEHEWVTLVSGRAALTVEDRGRVEMSPGDSLFLPSRTRHRLEWTSEDEPAVWIALFFRGPIPAALPDEAVARILGHMNDDHADSLLDYAHVFAEARDATRARMTSVDAAGFGLEVETPEGTRQLRLPFDPPVSDVKAARDALVAMAKTARAGR